jgi:hypothetical protein
MPQASDKLRAQMATYFGGSGIDDFPPYRYLHLHGWKDRAGMLIAPKREITQKEWDCVAFLCDEWDYAYDPDETRNRC